MIKQPTESLTSKTRNKMKKTHLIIVSALAIAAFSTGCTKTYDTAIDALKQGEATLARIMDFKQQMDFYKANPAIKDGETMTLDEAIWNIEALFNLTYAYPELSYGHTVTADTVLYLPVGSNNTVLLTDLTAFYEQMYAVVRDLYQAIELDNKQFLILDVEAGERHCNMQAIELNAMQGSVVAASDAFQNPRETPFEEGVSWYYGEDGGNSNGQYINIMDAADTLSRTLNANLVQVAPAGWQYSYTNIKMKELYPDQHWPYINGPNPDVGPYCEFYKENPTPQEYWMSSYQMNYHYNGECYLVQNVFRSDATDPIPSNYYLFHVSIEDRNLSGDTILHHTQARYGYRIVARPGDVHDRSTL